jgi:hypothetical protein
MRNKKISELDTNGGLHGTDLVPVSNAGGTKTFRLSMSELADFISSEEGLSPTKVSAIKTQDFPITTATTETIFLIDASENQITVTLNNHTQHLNQQLIFKRLNPHKDENEVAIEGRNVIITTGGQGSTIDGESSYTLIAQYETLTVVASNNGWNIL